MLLPALNRGGLEMIIETLVLVYFSYIFVWNIASLVYFIRCFKVKECFNINCLMNICCIIYNESPTREAIEELKRWMADNFDSDDDVERPNDRLL